VAYLTKDATDGRLVCHPPSREPPRGRLRHSSQREPKQSQHANGALSSGAYSRAVSVFQEEAVALIAGAVFAGKQGTQPGRSSSRAAHLSQAAVVSA